MVTLMEKTLAELAERRALVRLYTSTMNRNSSTRGQVLSAQDNTLVIRQLNMEGEWDGYRMTFIEDLIDIKVQDNYLAMLSSAITESPILDIPANSNDLIEWLIQTRRAVGIRPRLSDTMYGFITAKDDDYMQFDMFELGSPDVDGIGISKISDLVGLSFSTKSLALHEFSLPT
jgi:hypothetical protein